MYQNRVVTRNNNYYPSQQQQQFVRQPLIPNPFVPPVPVNNGNGNAGWEPVGRDPQVDANVESLKAMAENLNEILDCIRRLEEAASTNGIDGARGPAGPQGKKGTTPDLTAFQQRMELLIQQKLSEEIRKALREIRPSGELNIRVNPATLKKQE